MIFSVSNVRIQWTLDFGPDFVTIAVNDLDQILTISSQEIPLAAWQLLSSQRQDFSNNQLVQVPITPNQQRTFEMREVFSSVGAQDLDTSSYKVSDLEDLEKRTPHSGMGDLHEGSVPLRFAARVLLGESRRCQYRDIHLWEPPIWTA